MSVSNKNKRTVKIRVSIDKKMSNTIKYSKIEEEKANHVGISKVSSEINSIRIVMAREETIFQTKEIIKNSQKSEIKMTGKKYKEN